MTRRNFIISMMALPLTQLPTAWWPFLGPELLTGIQRTFDYGIAYQSNSFDQERKNRIKKSRNRLLETSPHLVQPFIEFATRMTIHNMIPTWIDLAFYDIKSKWLTAGSYRLPGAGFTCEQTAMRINSTQIFVEVKDTPFEVPGYPQGFYAAGSADGTRIKAVNVAANLWYSDPKNAYLSTFKDIVNWEMGNVFGNAAGYIPVNIESEVGNRIPGSF